MAGGLTRRRLYLVEGVPGSGKTTLAMQYLMAGAANGETVLYVTLSETEEELRSVAESHGWRLDGVSIRELVPSETDLDPDEQNTMFHPAELELASTMKLILTDVERLKPTRVVFDSLSELRLLAGTALRYRRQILALKQFFSTRDCTVVLLDDLTATDHDLQMQSIAHGVVLLEQLNPEYGTERRRLRVVKYRGVKFRGGYHDFVHRFRRTAGVSAAGCRRTPADYLPREAAQRHPRARRAAGRRHRRRHEHPHRRRRRHRQVHPGRPVRRRRRQARTARRAVHLRREPGDAAHPVRAVERRPREPARRRPGLAAAGRPGRAHAGRIRPRHPHGGGGAQRQGRRHRQPERLPQRHARRAASHHSAARAADVPRPERRRDDPDRGASGAHRRPDVRRRSMPPTWPTR